MGSDWRPSKWGEEISLEYGKALRGYKDAKGPFRVYGSNGPVGWTSEPLAPGPGVVLGRKGAYRGIEYSKEPFFVIDTAYYVKPKTNIHMRWLYYAIKHYKLGEINDGSPIPSTTRAAVYVRDLKIPSIEEQKAIAYILGSLDDKIELNRRMNETLEAMAKALFKSWFVDFDPVIDNALAAGNEIPEELKEKAAVRESLGDARKPLPEEVRSLFPGEFEHTEEMGWIPKGWEIGSLDDMVVLQRGFDLPKSRRIDGFYPLIAASGQDGTHNEAKVSGPGVVTGRSGRLGIVTFVQEDFWPLNTTLWIKEYKNSSPYHAFLLLSTLRFERFNAGSAVPTLNRNHIHDMKLVVPLKSLVIEFSNFVQLMFDKRFSNIKQIIELTKLRDILLPQLLSGEIRIPDAKKLMEGMF